MGAQSHAAKTRRKYTAERALERADSSTLWLQKQRVAEARGTCSLPALEPEVQGRAQALRRPRGRIRPGLSQPPGFAGRPWCSSVCGRVTPSLPAQSHGFSPGVCLCPNVPFLKGHQSRHIKSHPNGLILTRSDMKPLFLNKAHWQVPRGTQFTPQPLVMTY